MSKIKSCHPRRKTSEVERTFKNLFGKLPEVTNKPTEEILMTY